MGDLSRRSARGGGVTLVAQVLKFVLQMASTMVLARLLTPADFGLLAMVAFFTGLVGLFRDLGLSAATVQRLKVSHSQVSTLFWINVGASAILMVLTIAIAPLVAWFYGESELVWITMALSATFLFGGASAQHIALLRRQMRFVGLGIIEIGALVVGILSAVSVALLGGGYWSLVVLTVTTAIASAVLSWMVSGWRPGPWRFDSEVRSIIGFGLNITGANLLSYITRNVDNLLIGRVWGAAELGVYSKAYALLLMPMQQINGPIGAVAIPAMSRLQASPEAFRAYYVAVVKIIAYVSMPVVVMLGVMAEDLVLVLLGPQWGEAARIFQVFVIFVVIQNVVSTTGWVMQSRGRGDRMLRWGMFQAPILVIAVLIGLPWGGFGVAVAVTTQALLITVPAMIYAYHGSPVSLIDVAKAISTPVLFSLVLLAVAGFLQNLLGDASLLVRMVGVISGAGLLGISTFLLSDTVRRDVYMLRRLLARRG